jgi:hypothetical protein
LSQFIRYVLYYGLIVLVSEVPLEVFPQVKHDEVVLVIGLRPGQLVNLRELVYLEASGEGIHHGCVPGLGARDDVSQLNAVVGEVVHEVEVEITQELRTVMLDY